MRTLMLLSGVLVYLWLVASAPAAEPVAADTKPALANYFPEPESKGGWRSLLPKSGAPDAKQKEEIRARTGIDYDKLVAAWEFNAAAEGATGLLVIRNGFIVGEWYKDCDKDKTFNVYSSSKAYTSLAFGLILDDFGNPALPGGKKLTLDTKVCTQEWLPEALPLADPRKSDITVRHLLNMASGIGSEAVPATAPFEWSLGKVEDAPTVKLKGDPGTVFNYSNAGVAHLVLVFQRAAGKDLFPFLKERVFDTIGMEKVTWTQLGGNGKIGPFSQGYSGILTTPREHARFCYLALHQGSWSGKQVAPAGYYEFAWKGTKVKPDYGAQWWVQPRHPDAPKDLVQTAGARNNHGYVVPSLDLVVVRVGDGQKYAKGFEQDLVKKVIAAVAK